MAAMLSFLLTSTGCEEKKEQVRQEVKERVDKAREVKEKVQDGAKTVVKESADKLLHPKRTGMLALTGKLVLILPSCCCCNCCCCC